MLKKTIDKYLLILFFLLIKSTSPFCFMLNHISIKIDKIIKYMKKIELLFFIQFHPIETLIFIQVLHFDQEHMLRFNEKKEIIFFLLLIDAETTLETCLYTNVMVILHVTMLQKVTLIGISVFPSLYFQEKCW